MSRTDFIESLKYVYQQLEDEKKNPDYEPELQIKIHMIQGDVAVLITSLRDAPKIELATLERVKANWSPTIFPVPGVDA